MTPTNRCLDGETLAAWVDGGLSRNDAAMAEAHVSSCPRCQEIAGLIVKTMPAAIADATVVAPAGSLARPGHRGCNRGGSVADRADGPGARVPYRRRSRRSPPRRNSNRRRRPIRRQRRRSLRPRSRGPQSRGPRRQIPRRQRPRRHEPPTQKKSDNATSARLSWRTPRRGHPRPLLPSRNPQPPPPPRQPEARRRTACAADTRSGRRQTRHFT